MSRKKLSGNCDQCGKKITSRSISLEGEIDGKRLKFCCFNCHDKYKDKMKSEWKFSQDPTGKTVSRVEIDNECHGTIYFSDGTKLMVHPDELENNPDFNGEPTPLV